MDWSGAAQFPGLVAGHHPGQVAVIRYGWGACNPGLVRVFVNGINFELKLDDTVILTPEDVDDLWSKATIHDPQPDWPECVGNRPVGIRRMPVQTTHVVEE